MKSYAWLFALALALSVPAVAQAGVGLGSAAPYNVLVFGNYTGMNSDVEGRLAVGGDLVLNNYSVGSSLPGVGVTAADGPGLVVGGNLNWTNGQVFVGDAVYGASASTSGFTVLDGSLVQGAPLNFAALKDEMIGKSSAWASLDSSGTVDVNPYSQRLTLQGTDSGTNVFHLDASQWTGEIAFDLPTGAQAIVNISGTSAHIPSAGFFLNGMAADDIVFNFYEAESLTANGVGLYGHILAPNAHVGFNNGQHNGTLIADSFSGSLEFHIVGPPPPVDPSDPGDPYDPIPEPMSGVIWLGLGLIGLGYARRRRINLA